MRVRVRVRIQVRVRVRVRVRLRSGEGDLLGRLERLFVLLDEHVLEHGHLRDREMWGRCGEMWGRCRR